MNALGRGLASLIPKRDVSAKELLRRIDDDELDLDDEVEDVEKSGGTKINVVEDEADEGNGLPDFNDDEGEKLSPPSKPLTTPIPFAEEMMKEKGEMKREVVVKIEEEEVEVVDEKKDDDLSRRHEEQVYQIKISDIRINALQPRREFDSEKMEELMASIASHGILQPLVLLRLEDGEHELVAGERRMRAARELGWKEVPCVIRKDVRTDRSQLEMALVENLQRRDLNPIETAQAFKRLAQEYGLSHEEIAEHVGVSRAAVTNIMRFLQLPDEVQQGLIDGKLTQAHARACLMIPDPEKQIKFYRQIIREKVSVRQAEVRARRVRRAMNVTDRRREKGSRRVQVAKKWTAPLEEHFGSVARVRFLPAKNRFEVVFVAFTEQEIDGLVQRLLTGEKDNSTAEILADNSPLDDEDDE